MLGVSVRSSSFHINENYWECYLNNKLLIKGHTATPDSIVVLERNVLKQKGVINFRLFLDAPTDREIETSTFLVSSNGAKVLVSKDRATQLRGHFTLNKLGQVSDSLKSRTLELQCYFDGIDKPWRMFKFELQN